MKARARRSLTLAATLVGGALGATACASVLGIDDLGLPAEGGDAIAETGTGGDDAAPADTGGDDAASDAVADARDADAGGDAACVPCAIDNNANPCGLACNLAAPLTAADDGMGKIVYVDGTQIRRVGLDDGADAGVLASRSTPFTGLALAQGTQQIVFTNDGILHVAMYPSLANDQPIAANNGPAVGRDVAVTAGYAFVQIADSTNQTDVRFCSLSACSSLTVFSQYASWTFAGLAASGATVAVLRNMGTTTAAIDVQNTATTLPWTPTVLGAQHLAPGAAVATNGVVYWADEVTAGAWKLHTSVAPTQDDAIDGPTEGMAVDIAGNALFYTNAKGLERRSPALGSVTAPALPTEPAPASPGPVFVTSGAYVVWVARGTGHGDGALYRGHY